MPLTYSDYLTSIFQLLSGHRTANEERISEDRFREISPFIKLMNTTRILDLANGRLRPQYTLINTKGYQAFGLDIANNKDDYFQSQGYRLARWIYKSHIGDRISSEEDRLVSGDVNSLPYKNDIFDLITSVAAFEHFLDVPGTVCEIHRVIQVGGFAYIRIHLFTCLSGGHNIKIMEIPLQTLPKGVDAWDHLRKRQLPFDVPLNRWRIHQYLEEFSRHFEIVNHYCASREGEHLLTPEIEAELSDYSRDELTCGAYVIVARKS